LWSRFGQSGYTDFSHFEGLLAAVAEEEKSPPQGREVAVEITVGNEGGGRDHQDILHLVVSQYC